MDLDSFIAHENQQMFMNTLQEMLRQNTATCLKNSAKKAKGTKRCILKQELTLKTIKTIQKIVKYC